MTIIYLFFWYGELLRLTDTIFQFSS